MKNFEDRLKRLEAMSEQIRKPGLALDEALKIFEEGIKLARGLEKDLDQIDNKVQILMTGPEATEQAKPELELFGDEV